MVYEVEVYQVERDPYTESGEWMDGDARTIREWPMVRYTFDPTDDPWATPLSWAVEMVSATWATEPSSYPIGDRVRAHEWLMHTDSPYGSEGFTETTVRLTGAWTEEERAKVWHAIVEP